MSATGQLDMRRWRPDNWKCPRCGWPTTWVETDEGGYGIRCETRCSHCRRKDVWYYRSPDEGLP